MYAKKMKYINNILYEKTRCFFFPFFRVLSCALLIIFLLASGTPFFLQDKPDFLSPATGADKQGEIVKAEEIIRFHVRAHSNSPGDQEIKNYLAQKILCLYGSRWSNCHSREELRLLMAEDREAMEVTAHEILEENGFSHDVKISLEKSLFPARLYYGKLYPPGEYEALNMIIGDGDGENWWCVLFPPLCLNLILPPPNEGIGKLPVEEKDSESFNQAAPKENKKPEWRFWLLEVLTGKKAGK